MTTAVQTQQPETDVLRSYRDLINELRGARTDHDAWPALAGRAHAGEANLPTGDEYVSFGVDLLFSEQVVRQAMQEGAKGVGRIDFLVDYLESEFRLRWAEFTERASSLGGFPDPAQPATWLLMPRDEITDGQRAEAHAFGTCICGASPRREGAGYTRFVNGRTAHFCRRCGDELATG